MSEDPFQFLNYLWVIITAPIVLIYNKITSHEGRISATEAKQETYEKKVDKMCKSSEKLSEEVHKLIGRVDEHLRRTPS